MPAEGAQSVVRDYAIELKKRGYDVKVLVLFRYPDSVNEKLLSEEGIPLIDIWGKVTNKLGHRIIRKIFGKVFAYKKIKRLIKEEEPDIIHVHLRLMKYLYPVRNYLKKTGIVYTCHSEVSSIFDFSKKGNRKDEKCLRWFLKNRNVQIIALHSRMKEELEKLFEIENVKILCNPVNISHIKNHQGDRRMMRKELNIPQNAYVIGHIGRFAKEKNHEFLVRIFKKFSLINENAFLLLVGSGPLLSQIRDQIKLLGVESNTLILSNREDIPEILAAMDVFVFPSLFEGLGIVLLEAQVAGIPCIASSAIPEEVICTDYMQLLRLDEEEEKWVEAINRPAITNGGKKNNINNFDINIVMNQLEKIYAIF